MNAGVATISGLALIVGGWMWFHKDAAKTTTLLFLVAGLGFGGVLGNMLGNFVNRAIGTVGTTTGTWVGISASTIVAGIALVATLEVVLKGMLPKTAKTRRWHPFLALVLPSIVIAGGVPLLAYVMSAFSTGVGNVGGALSQLGG
jgi:hypothetical protein